MARLFVDSWGWLAVRDRGERQHQAAVTVFNGAQVAGGGIVTTDYVLDEAFTLLFRRLALHKAEESVAALLAAIDEGSVSLAAITPTRFAEAVKLRMKYGDRPEISFTDFTSMVVMRELGLKRVLTEDGHFAQVGLGFELVP
jgi:predicted nucleic acid-binding protein